MKRHSTALLALAAAQVTLLVVACSDDETPSPAEPGPDASADSASQPDTGVPPPSDGGAPDVVVPDLPPAPIQCSVTPCALELATAGNSMCARLSDGTVRCWGSDDSGQLGRGGVADGQDPLPAPVADLAGVTQLSAGTDAYCVTLEDKSVKCWGNNGSGQLGSVDPNGSYFSPVPVAVGGLPEVRGVFMGDGIACAALAGGDVMCWGQGTFGRIPAIDGSSDPQPPTRIALGGRRFSAIAPGSSAIVALAEDGQLVSWGRWSKPNYFEVSTLGREASLNPAAPSALPSPTHAMLLAGAGEAACAASQGGALRWGTLSGSTGPVIPAPVTFATTAKVQGVSIASTGQFCAVLSDDSARCLGRNDNGQLGTGDFLEIQLVPAKVQNLPAHPVRIVTSAYHACAILETGAVMCWGNNSRGQLGTGDFALTTTPAAVRFTP